MCDYESILDAIVTVPLIRCLVNRRIRVFASALSWDPELRRTTTLRP